MWEDIAVKYMAVEIKLMEVNISDRVLKIPFEVYATRNLQNNFWLSGN